MINTIDQNIGDVVSRRYGVGDFSPYRRDIHYRFHVHGIHSAMVDKRLSSYKDAPISKIEYWVRGIWS